MGRIYSGHGTREVFIGVLPRGPTSPEESESLSKVRGFIVREGHRYLVKVYEFEFFMGIEINKYFTIS